MSKPMTAEELIARVIGLQYHPHQEFGELADGIKADLIYFGELVLKELKEAGYVKLAEDQSLPRFSFSEEPPNMRFGYQKAQQDMLKAGFRRVEL